ncbi:MAG: HAD family hydrolase, partial [Chrysiogenetes bacterium]|nr:HAD family hydrolase [Chrysiogenetes bacterium]
RYENIVHALELEVEGEESRRLAHELVEAHMRAIARSTRAVEGAAALLDRLHARGIGVALISNFDYTPAADWILDHTGLQGRFDKVIISDALGLRKPHEKLFEDAMSHFGASPAESLHIGDTALADIWGAGRLGIRTVWINRKGEAFPHDEHAPSLEITRLAELLDYLPD